MTIREECLFKIIRAPHVSEKTSIAMKNSNTMVVKIINNVTKKEIFDAIKKIFKIEVKHINTLIIKGKVRRYKKYVGRRSNWKKAYVTFKEGQDLSFLSDN